MVNKCVLCGKDCETKNNDIIDVTYYECSSCGKFAATNEAEEDFLTKISLKEKQRIAACTRERNFNNLPDLLISSHESIHIAYLEYSDIRYILDVLFPSRIQDRLDRVLTNLGKMTDIPGEAVRIVPLDDLPILFAESPDAAVFILRELENLGYLISDTRYDTSVTDKPPTEYYDVTILGAGYERLQDLKESQARTLSKQIFVAMWFNNELNEIFEQGIVPAIKDCGLDPLRIDAKESNGKICDAIIAEIRRSKVVVADFTGSRGGVYYEAGFAMGLEIPVIWSCRNLPDDIKELHFDTRQYNHILWDSAEDMRKKLRNRIAATIPGIVTSFR